LLAVTRAGSGASILAAIGGGNGAGAGSGLAAATTTGAGCGAGSGLTATTGADAATGAAARTGAGSVGAVADTCIGASDAVVPAFTDSVFTSTGRIGSVEPAAVRGCAAAAIDSVLVVAAGSACAAGAEFSRTGKLTALATANRASALGSGFASVLAASVLAASVLAASVLAATFGSGFASTLAATFG